MSHPLHHYRAKFVTPLTETFGLSPLLASLTAGLSLLLVAAAILWVVLSAPPRTLTISSGPAGSVFERYAGQYQKALAAHGITLKIIPSAGSLENLQRLRTPGSGIDLAFVQGGLVGDAPPPELVSLGSISYQPLWIFYRAPTPCTRLSELAGKRLGVGATGSGVHTLALALLEANGIGKAPTVLVEEETGKSGTDLLEGRLDAVFLMGDSAPTQTLRALIRAPGVQLYNFTQADAYVRRLTYLNKMVLPEGSIDFASDLPAQDTVLIGPGIELVAHENLNSAVTDLMLEIAQQVHGKPTLLARRGEFPAPLEREFPLSADALRFYKSGQALTYKLIGSFWLANLVNRLLVAIVPVVLILIPTVRLVPLAYRWSVQLRIYRCYRQLLALERDAAPVPAGERAAKVGVRLDEIEREVNRLRIPASFASQFYDLRNHVAIVRERWGGAGR